MVEGNQDCFCLNQPECGVSFQWQRDTEGSDWQPSMVSEASMDTLGACGCTQHPTGGLGHRQPDSGGWRYTHAGFPLSLHPEPVPPMPFHHPTLPSGGTKGSQQRGKWVLSVAVWERWERGGREDTERVGRNGLLAVQVQCSLLQTIL